MIALQGGHSSTSLTNDNTCTGNGKPLQWVFFFQPKKHSISSTLQKHALTITLELMPWSKDHLPFCFKQILAQRSLHKTRNNLNFNIHSDGFKGQILLMYSFMRLLYDHTYHIIENKGSKALFCNRMFYFK